jgi:hypothetical protein
MGDRAGDLDFVNHPVAQHLLTCTEPAQVAYTWLDGTPRSVPMWFHWDGAAVVLGTPLKAPKVAALRANPVVAITIEQHAWPYQVLFLRGDAAVEDLDDVSPEYAAAAERYFGPEQGRAWTEQLRGKAMARVRVTPNWANVLDFQTRFPSALAV